MLSRLEKINKELESRDLDACIVTNLLNVRYLSGFTGSNGILAVGKMGAVLFTDSRYDIQACAECAGVTIHIIDYNWPPHIAQFINDLKLKRVGFEEDSVNYRHWKSLSDLLPPDALVPLSGLVEELRMIKDADEIALIREAARIADIVFDEVISKIKPGIREVDIAIEMDYCMRRNGADKEGFDTIVASGTRSALPHGKASERVIGPEDLIVFDYGAEYGGYHSDITRTQVAGHPTEKQMELYNIVLEAQKRAIDTVRSGVTGKEVDSAARDYLNSQGCGGLFTHGLGHGLGLDIHDPGTLNQRGNITLKPGMVFTVEPGIYNEDWGGIRIEDDVLVTKTGCEILTHTPKVLGLI